MWYSDKHGVIKTPKAIILNGMNHPASIFRLWSKEELAKIGITPARVNAPDPRYYDAGDETYSLVDGETVIGYSGSEKNVEDLKKRLVNSIKKHVGILLSSSDWRVIREADGGTPMTSSWKTYRSDVRAHGNSLESGVEAFASVDAVRNFQNHEVTEIRYLSTRDADGKETIGPETENRVRIVDKTYWGWPVAPDAPVDPYHADTAFVPPVVNPPSA
jgi:hypothetical protein